MKPKTIVTAGLTVFVLASVVTLVVKEAGVGQTRPSTKSAEPVSGSGTKLIAYYLHGKVRCVTCNDIEKSAKEAVESGFAEELKHGRIEWRSVNYEEPGNEHYATDYKLAAPCVVLASIRDGRQESWKSLPEVWELIGDKRRFHDFIRQSIREQLGDSPRREPASDPAVRAVDVALPSPLEAPRNLPRLLDVGSTRCIPCKQMAPILEQLRTTYRTTLEVVFIDLLEDSTAAETYGVSTIPTQIFFDASGKELFRHEGFFSREEILGKWRELGIDIEGGTQS